MPKITPSKWWMFGTNQGAHPTGIIPSNVWNQFGTPDFDPLQPTFDPTSVLPNWWLSLGNEWTGSVEDWNKAKAAFNPLWFTDPKSQFYVPYLPTGFNPGEGWGGGSAGGGGGNGSRGEGRGGGSPAGGQRSEGIGLGSVGSWIFNDPIGTQRDEGGSRNPLGKTERRVGNPGGDFWPRTGENMPGGGRSSRFTSGEWPPKINGPRTEGRGWRNVETLSPWEPPDGDGGGGGGGGGTPPGGNGDEDEYTYDWFRRTGGYTPEDLANIRGRSLSVIPAMYERLANELARRRSIQGGYSPGYGATAANLGRGEAQSLSSANLDIESQIANAVRSGRLAGLGGLAQMYQAVPGVLNMYNQDLLSQYGMSTDAYTRMLSLLASMANTELNVAGQQDLMGSWQNILELIMRGGSSAANIWAIIMDQIRKSQGTKK